MTLAQVADLYDATVDDVWRTARGSGASVAEASDAVTEAYVALSRLAEPVDHPRLWLMSRVYRTVRPEVVAA